MTAETIRRMRVGTMRQGARSPIRDARQRALPTKNGHAALWPSQATTREYQSDSSSKRSASSSAVSVPQLELTRPPPRQPAIPIDRVVPYQSHLLKIMVTVVWYQLKHLLRGEMSDSIPGSGRIGSTGSALAVLVLSCYSLGYLGVGKLDAHETAGGTLMCRASGPPTVPAMEETDRGAANGLVEGIVLNKWGEPVLGARVSICCDSERCLEEGLPAGESSVVRTDKSGSFRLQYPRGIEHSIRTDRYGYRSVEIPVGSEPAQSTEKPLRITLSSNAHTYRRFSPSSKKGSPTSR